MKMKLNQLFMDEYKGVSDKIFKFRNELIDIKSNYKKVPWIVFYWMLKRKQLIN